MVTLTFTGTDQIVAAMATFSVELRQEVLYDALQEAAEPIRARMAALAPRGDPKAPNIADNIVVKKQAARGGGYDGTAAVAIGPTRRVSYAVPVELGFAHFPDGRPVPPRPFARPAFEEGKAAALVTIGRRLWDVLSGRGSRSATSGLL